MLCAELARLCLFCNLGSTEEHQEFLHGDYAGDFTTSRGRREVNRLYDEVKARIVAHRY